MQCFLAFSQFGLFKELYWPDGLFRWLVLALWPFFRSFSLSISMLQPGLCTCQFNVIGPKTVQLRRMYFLTCRGD